MTIKTQMTIWLVVIILGVSGGIFYILKSVGMIKIGAEAIVGCQNSKMISALFGRPGTNLTSYNFFGNDITINEMLAPFLDKVQQEIKDAKIDYSFNNVTAYNYRLKRGGGGTSLHSWGIAIDINPGNNPFGSTQTDIPRQVIDIFKKHGFFWGGDWGGRDYDPMHFEWYGASVSGQTIDNISQQKVLNAATAIDKSGSPNSGGDFVWVVPAGTHEITAISRGYKETKFTIDLTCFSQDSMDINLEPLPSNVPGSIAGHVGISGNYPLLVPANIYLDDKLVTISNLKGDYYIPNVHEGKHQVGAKLMFTAGSSKTVELVPGENINNINIVIGK